MRRTWDRRAPCLPVRLALGGPGPRPSSGPLLTHSTLGPSWRVLGPRDPSPTPGPTQDTWKHRSVPPQASLWPPCQWGPRPPLGHFPAHSRRQRVARAREHCSRLHGTTAHAQHRTGDEPAPAPKGTTCRLGPPGGPPGRSRAPAHGTEACRPLSEAHPHTRTLLPLQVCPLPPGSHPHPGRPARVAWAHPEGCGPRASQILQHSLGWEGSSWPLPRPWAPPPPWLQAKDRADPTKAQPPTSVVATPNRGDRRRPSPERDRRHACPTPACPRRPAALLRAHRAADTHGLTLHPLRAVTLRPPGHPGRAFRPWAPQQEPLVATGALEMRLGRRRNRLSV